MKTYFPSRDITFPRRALLMGIVNVNDDSFSGDGTLDSGEALAQAKQQIENGADMIDVGAESARTNREAISPKEKCKFIMLLQQGSGVGANLFFHFPHTGLDRAFAQINAALW